MSEQDPAERINKLEILFAEQEYTIETLNTIVTRQSNEIARLWELSERFKQQLQDFKQQLPEGNISDEKPPHY